MKIRRLIILAVLFLIISSCEEQEVQHTQICVLIDVTDEKFKESSFVEADLQKLLKLMKLDDESDGYSGGEIKLSLINEVSDSKSKSISISAAETGMLGENPLNRRDEVERFRLELENSFSNLIENADWGTNASKIYQKVTRELLKMKRKTADRNYLVIYSDMLENSELFSFYGTNWQTTIKELTANPEKTLDQLAKTGPAMPDLSEFEIFLIASRNADNDEKINLSEQLWTALFEFKGAVVNSNSNLEL